MMEYKQWIDALRSVIKEFSSAEYQERVWLHGEGPEVSSYVEAMCRFFDDFDADRLIDIEWQQAGLTDIQHASLVHLRDNLRAFGEMTPETPLTDEILNHPDWPIVRKAAHDALMKLSKFP